MDTYSMLEITITDISLIIKSIVGKLFHKSFNLTLQLWIIFVNKNKISTIQY